jgi:hypothetical protein
LEFQLESLESRCLLSAVTWDSEPNANRRSAQEVVFDMVDTTATLIGHVSAPSDRDWYVVRATGAGTLRIVFEGLMSDVQVSVWGESSNGRRFREQATGVGSAAEWQVASESDFYLRVQRGDAPSSSYQLKLVADVGVVETVAQSDSWDTATMVWESENNNVSRRANEVDFGGRELVKLQGAVRNRRDQDWYVFTADRLGVIELDVQSRSMEDIGVEVIDAESMDVLFRTSSSAGESAPLFTTFSGATYFVRALGVARATSYEIEMSYVDASDLFTLSFVGAATAVTGLNDHGEAIGWGSGNAAPTIVASASSAKSLPIPDGYSMALPTGINDSGVVVGYVQADILAAPQAVVWRPDGMGGYETEFLATMDGFAGGRPTDINNDGVVIGYAANSGGDVGGPPVWFNSPAGPVDLRDYGLSSTPAAVNNLNQVVSGNRILDLDDMSLMSLSLPAELGGVMLSGVFYPGDINDAGQVVGHALVATALPTNQMNVRYTPGIGFERMPAASLSVHGTAYSINNSGAAVGAVPTGYYYTADGRGLPLFELLAPGYGQWVFGSLGLHGIEINDQGQIAAIAENSTTSEAGIVILTPIPRD